MVAEISREEWLSKFYVVDCAIGCWLWVGTKNKGGYGSCSTPTGTRNAHRVAFEIHRGDIGDGMDLDHLCRVRACVNPWHLEPVTRSTNLRRGLAGRHVAVAQLAKTHCPKGHRYDNDNTYHRADKIGRQCKPCMRAATKEWRARRVEK